MLGVSVIIPVYNASAFLEKAVYSALQFEEVTEIVLVEDGSSDHSLSIAEKLASAYPKIKLFQHPDKGNHGAGASRNLGIDKASGEYIAFLDSDDYYLPNRFDMERQYFKDPSIDGVFGGIGIEYLSEKGKEEFQRKFKNMSITTVAYAAKGEEVFRGLLGLSAKTFGTFFHLNTLTVRKAALEKNSLRFNKDLRVHQDSDFIIKLSHHTFLTSGIIDDAVAIRGVHDDNRITKIKKYSKEYNERQLLLWTSLYKWAKLRNLPAEYQKRIYLNYRSFDLAVKTGIQKYICLLSELVKNPEILKTKYRFTYLNR
ncbi:glycosyltransferase family 2 protein [Chryseobacterium sp. MYb264]|uniref:glycosyltransferase family 2 protein n=1 Tax=Chryseobacterium sp. MYb264 TaxID=2745153 RepID=UPI002E168501|nr:glycosyltransferase family 2 protein [Chryseobacterium sp. MYb264]